MIHHGDCLDMMAGMDPESVDAIVTDPPYGIRFMGKAWDGADIEKRHKQVERNRVERGDTSRTTSGFANAANAAGQYDRSLPSQRAFQSWCYEWAEAAYRVAKPSAYLLAFGGTRTVHRMTCALEDAGWIIRDMLVWGYASGFPKSKASLKPAWEPIVMARKPGPLRMLAIDECRIPGGTRPLIESRSEASLNAYGDGLNGSRAAGTTDTARWPANIVLTDPIFDGGIEGVVGGGEAVSRGGAAFAAVGYEGGWTPPNDGTIEIGYGDTGTYSRFFSIPVQYGVCRYCGVPIADESSTASPTPDTRSGTAPVDASSPLSSSLSDHAPSAAVRSDGVGASTARQAVGLWPDEGGESRPADLSTSDTEIGSSPRPEPTTPTIPRSRLPVTSPRSMSPSGPATSADRTGTSSDTMTTTPSRLMCAFCADLATAGYIQDAMSTGRRASRAVPADEDDHTRFLIVPKAARSDREPVLGGLPLARKADDGPIVERVYNPDPTTIADYLREHRERLGISRPEMDRRLGTVTLYSWFEGRPAGTQLPTPEMWLRLKDVLAFDDRHDEEMTATRLVTLEERDERSEAVDLAFTRRMAGLGKLRANHHPTVKPVDLMRHLVRLVTPTGGVVLDPFLGSGTTALAAEMEGFAWIGIEREAEYVAIAEARLNGTQKGMAL